MLNILFGVPGVIAVVLIFLVVLLFSKSKNLSVCASNWIKNQAAPKEKLNRKEKYFIRVINYTGSAVSETVEDIGEGKELHIQLGPGVGICTYNTTCTMSSATLKSANKNVESPDELIPGRPQDLRGRKVTLIYCPISVE